MSRQISTLNAIHSTIAILTIALIAIVIHVCTCDFDKIPAKVEYAGHKVESPTPKPHHVAMTAASAFVATPE